MKNTLNAYNKYFSILAKRLDVSSNWQLAFKARAAMMGYVLRVPLLLLGRNGRTWVLASVAFAKFALRMKAHCGYKGLAIVLKVSHTLIIKSVSGKPVRDVASSLGHRVAVTSGGLPRWIPAIHRRQIRCGHVPTIRFWLTLCSMYRILTYPGRLNLSTITTPGPNIDMSKYESFVKPFFRALRKEAPKEIRWPTWTPQIIMKSGPGAVRADSKRQYNIGLVNTTVAMVVQAIAFHARRFDSLRKSFESLAVMFGFQSLLTKRGAHTGLVAKMLAINRAARAVRIGSEWVPKYLGKLGIKEEPGKVRVFAMVDWWTQMLLRPVHLYILDILKQIPMDSTFDQDAGVARGIEIMRSSGFAASYDLSAATDRLPLVLQARLINQIFPSCGVPWSDLLTGRAYATPKGPRRWGFYVPESVRYAVGQPMGALSSWALLALTHHFIVQMAAAKVGRKGWFSLYQVLGDDIVIFDRDVAAQYLIEMATLGVKINLVKSVVSMTSFEFAKRFVHQGQNCSALSFKELDVASKSLDALMVLYSKVSKDAPVRLSAMVRFRGGGYKVLATLMNPFNKMSIYWRSLLLYALRPGISPASVSSWTEWLSLSSVCTTVALNYQSLQDSLQEWANKLSPLKVQAWKEAILSPVVWPGKDQSTIEGPFHPVAMINKLWRRKDCDPNPSDMYLMDLVNRLLYIKQVELDSEKKQLAAFWKNVAYHWSFATPEEAEATLRALFNLVDFQAAIPKDPDVSVFRDDETLRVLAPRYLRLFKLVQKSRQLTLPS